MELATRIDRNATARVSQYGMPRANRIFGVGDSADDDESIMPMVQGYTPTVFRMDGDQLGRDFLAISVTRAVLLLAHAMPLAPVRRVAGMPARITIAGSTIRPLYVMLASVGVILLHNVTS